jgi:hypothetical protein
MQMERRNCVIEALEVRAHLSGNPLTISQSPTPTGVALVINASSADDHIVVKPGLVGLRLENGDWSAELNNHYTRVILHAGAGNDSVVIDPTITLPTFLYGDAGDDTLSGGMGDDRLFGGAGADNLLGNAGNDILTDVGSSKSDQFAGGDGKDAFWADASPTEIITDLSADERASRLEHRVKAFFSPNAPRKTSPSKLTAANIDPLAQRPLDPAADRQMTWRNFSANPLFSDAGPLAEDVEQGSVGDCYLMAALSAIAKANPAVIENRIAELGDGTYLVEFQKNAKAQYIRVDADLPINPIGGIAYANTGRDGALWVALFEKAYALYRAGAGSYTALNSGWMNEVHKALGQKAAVASKFATGQSLLMWISGQLDTHHAVTFGTRDANGAPVMSQHAYMVDQVILDKAGQPTALRLRNPWGIDAVPNSSPDDGYVTLTPQQALGSLWSVTSAAVMA